MSVTTRVLAGKNLPQVAGAGAPLFSSSFVTVQLLGPSEQALNEGLENVNPIGAKTQVVDRNANPQWNTDLVMDKVYMPGSRLLFTVWHRHEPPKGGNLKLGIKEIVLPAQPTPMWITIEDTSGVAVQGSGGGFAEVQVQVLVPGDQAARPMAAAYSPGIKSPSGQLTESQMDNMGYTKDQIKYALFKQKTAMDEEARVEAEKKDINDELFRAAAVEAEALKEIESNQPDDRMRNYQPNAPTMMPSPNQNNQINGFSAMPQQPHQMNGMGGGTMPPQRMSALPQMPMQQGGPPRLPTAFLNGKPIYSDDPNDPFGGEDGGLAGMGGRMEGSGGGGLLPPSLPPSLPPAFPSSFPLLPPAASVPPIRPQAFPGQGEPLMMMEASPPFAFPLHPAAYAMDQPIAMEPGGGVQMIGMEQGGGVQMGAPLAHIPAPFHFPPFARYDEDLSGEHL